jgi:hypothetical protein
MKAAIRLSCACLLCAALAGCGASASSGSSDRQQITNLFNGIYAAMARGDYATACGDLSASQQAKVVAGVKRAGVEVSSCADALTTVIKRAGLTRAQLAQTFGAGGGKRKLDSISVHGNQATVTFTETTAGQNYVETDALVRQGGRWKADRILKRSQSS